MGSKVDQCLPFYHFTPIFCSLENVGKCILLPKMVQLTSKDDTILVVFRELAYVREEVFLVRLAWARHAVSFSKRNSVYVACCRRSSRIRGLVHQCVVVGRPPFQGVHIFIQISCLAQV